MLPVKTDKINKIIDKNFTYNFVVADEGIYLIEITARANSRWQNLKQLKSIFRRDVLAVEIDGLKFPALQKKSAFFDGEMVWNGNQLKGLAKTQIFVIYLQKGQHNILFLNKVKPTLENITITKTVDEKQLDCLPTTNNPPEKGDGRPWISYAFVDLAAKELNITAKTDKKGRDDEDIKLIINGKIEKNENKKSHHDWLWCGKILKGKTAEITKVLNFDGQGTHIIELWADNSPRLKKMEIELLGIKAPKEEKIKKKRITTVDDPEWTGDFRGDTEQMILARALWGEARNTAKQDRIAVAWSIKNRLGARKKWNSYHNIILDPDQYSCFWEKFPKDSNLKALQNPAKDSLYLEKWQETYEIAAKVMAGELSDPTSGANHYYDDSILEEREWMKKGKNKIKIGRFIFMYLP